MNDIRPLARERILAAATEITKEQGPAHMSLDAVAARAGVSKGGLLYHFPSKAKLLEAIVANHVDFAREAILSAAARDEKRANCFGRAYVEAFRGECKDGPPPAGILAAIAENPGFIDPIRKFQKEIVERLRRECPDPRPALTAFLAIEGIRALDLFDAQVLTAGERATLIDYMKDLMSTMPTGLSEPAQ